MRTIVASGGFATKDDIDRTGDPVVKLGVPSNLFTASERSE